MSKEDIKNILDDRQNLINENNKLKLKISRLIEHFEDLYEASVDDLLEAENDQEKIERKAIKTEIGYALKNIKTLKNEQNRKKTTRVKKPFRRNFN